MQTLSFLPSFWAIAGVVGKLLLAGLLFNSCGDSEIESSETVTSVPRVRATAVATATSTYAPTATPTPIPPSAFLIEGLTSQSNVFALADLTDGSAIVLHWSASNYQDNYDVSITTAADVTICAFSDLAASTTFFALSSCSLLTGKIYRAHVMAKNAGVTDTAASNDPYQFRILPKITITDTAQSEAENVLSGNIIFPLSLEVATEWDVTVNWQTLNGSASATGIFADYMASNTALTFLAGETTKEMAVSLINDTYDEPAEQDFSLSLFSPAGAILVNSLAYGTILDDDAAPTISLTLPANRKTEGSVFTFTATLSNLSENDTSFDWQVDAATSTAGVDYTIPVFDRITIPSSASTTAFVVSSLNDIVWCEPHENFSATISNFTNITTIGSSASATATILENDLPSVVVSDAVISEGSKAVFSLALSQACLDESVTLNWSAAGISAMAESDFIGEKGTIVLAPGETAANFAVQTLEDNLPELAEFFSVAFTSTDHVAISGSVVGKATIQDNDFASGLAVSKMAIGAEHTCALLSTGKVKCWGYTENGRLGIVGKNRGDQTGEMGDNLPTVSLGSSWTIRAIGGGSHHNCALLNNGLVDRIKCWGDGINGVLGYDNGFSDDQSLGDSAGEMGDNLPLIDLGYSQSIKKLSVGSEHSCVLFTDGKVKCFGLNSSGQLGYGNTTSRYTAITMGSNLPFVNLGTGKTATDISAGGSFTCAVLNDGGVKCWGSGADGRLGSEASTNI